MGSCACLDLALDKELTPVLLLGILITWSPEDIGVGINASLIQCYSILLSTFLTIGRNQLSIFDVVCALNLTSPPVVVYLEFFSICEIFGARTGL